MFNLTAREIINILEGLSLLLGAWFFYKFRTGSVNYKGEREEMRRKKIEQYGPLFLVGSVICFFSGILIIALTLF